MTRIKKKTHTAEFKFKVALEAFRGEQTIAELCQKFGVASSQIHKWKTGLMQKGAEIYKDGLQAQPSDSDERDKLHATIGRLKIENDFLAKCAGRSQ
jgi:transposase